MKIILENLGAKIYLFTSFELPEFLKQGNVEDLGIKIAKLLAVIAVYLIGLYIIKFLYKNLLNQINNSNSLMNKVLSKINMYNIEEKDIEDASNDFSDILKWIYYSIVVIFTYLILPFALNIFEWSREVGNKMLDFIARPFLNFMDGFAEFLPVLFEILVIFLIFRATIKILNYVFDKIKEGKIKINGFYKEWAKPTSNIIKLILYAFLLTIILPLLPGSDSDIFKGVSVFLGLILSLGSTSVIANALSGIIMTYMRPFVVGDRIEVENISGVVVQKNLLMTRVRTTKNVIVTIPNSKILSGHSKNFSTAASRSNLIIHIPFTIGYDVDWRVVHRLMKNAAKITNGVIEKSGKESFVLQKQLDSFSVQYEINCYVAQADKYLDIKSELIANILDEFNKAEIEILSPRYTASRDGETRTFHKIPEEAKVDDLDVKIDNINDKINEKAENLEEDDEKKEKS
jgi:small-conductance mechanosensitive channel